MCQPWILAGERSLLLTRIATTERVTLYADEKLIAFLELESAIDRLQQDEVLKPLQCCFSVTVRP